MVRSWESQGICNNKKIECKNVWNFFCHKFWVHKFAKNCQKCLMMKVTITNFFRFLNDLFNQKGKGRKLKNPPLFTQFISFGGSFYMKFDFDFFYHGSKFLVVAKLNFIIKQESSLILLSYDVNISSHFNWISK